MKNQKSNTHDPCIFCEPHRHCLTHITYTPEVHQMLTDLQKALKALPSKALIRSRLKKDDNYCAIGAMCLYFKVPILDNNTNLPCFKLNPDTEGLCEVIWTENDLHPNVHSETNEERYERMLAWTDTALKNRRLTLTTFPLSPHGGTRSPF